MGCSEQMLMRAANLGEQRKGAEELQNVEASLSVFTNEELYLLCCDNLSNCTKLCA